MTGYDFTSLVNMGVLHSVLITMLFFLDFTSTILYLLGKISEVTYYTIVRLCLLVGVTILVSQWVMLW